MSHVVALEKVNQFLPHEKMEVVKHSDVNDLEETARDIVFGKLALYYDTPTWTTPATTPSMVNNILGLLVAGWVYDRQFSEEAAEGGSYGSRRVEEAYRLLEGILAGEYDIGDMLPTATGGAPSVLETEPLFAMGEAF